MRDTRTPKVYGSIVFVVGWMLGMLLVCIPAYSQVNFGRILGNVTDPSGAVLAGATVTVTNVGTNVSRTLTTESDGAYVAAALPPGTYTVRAGATGFKTAEHQGVLLEVGRDVRVDVALELGTATQTVTVSEAVPLVDTTSATLGGTLSNEAINELPLNGRNFQNLVTLRPGVMIQPGGSAWTQSTNGLRTGATVYYLDGLMDNDFLVGWTVVNAPSPTTEAASVLPIDAIQEFNLEQNPKAEFGWKAGEVINVGIKSGTNSLHGSAYAFGRMDSWDARNFFNIVPQAKLPLELKNFGATVGGPIIKDKLFFFGGYEGRRDLIGNTFGLAVPETIHQTVDAANCPAPVTGDCANSTVDAIAALTAAGVPVSPVSQKLKLLFPDNPTSSTSISLGFPNTNLTDNIIAKVDYHINAHHMLNGMLFFNRYTGIGEDRPYANAKFLAVETNRAWVNNYTWIWTPNSRWVNEARFGFNRQTQNTAPADGGVSATTYGIDTGITRWGGLPGINIGTFAPLGASLTRPSFQGPSPLYDGIDNVSYVRGSHTFKFGFELAHITGDTGVPVFGRGQLNFGGGGTVGVTLPNAFNCPPPNATSSCSTALEDFFSGNASFPALQNVGDPFRHVRQWAYSGFFQDDWRVTPRVTLNLGLRYDYFAPLTERNNLIGSFDPKLGLVQVGQQLSSITQPDRTNFSPRFGIAWDPTGHGRTAIRAGANLLYDHPFLGLFLIGPGIATIPTGFTYVSFPGPGGTTKGTGTIHQGVVASGVGPAEWNGVVFPPNPTGPECAFFAPCNLNGVVPNFKTPYVGAWNLGVQHSFTSTLGLDVEYVGNHGKSLPQQTDINRLDPVTGLRPYGTQFPYLGSINMWSSLSWSNYNGLQVSLTKHSSHGLSFIAGYTYAHATDVSSLDAFALLPQDSAHPEREHASSDFDVRHRFTLTTTYNIPGRKSPLQLLEGWEINSIVTLQTGQPWTAISSTPLSSSSNALLAAAGDISLTGDLIDRWDFFGNPSDFTATHDAIPFCSGDFASVGTITCVSYHNATNQPSTSLSAAQTQAAFTACKTNAPSIDTLNSYGCYAQGKSVMVPPALGTFGTMGRNLFRDSGFRNWDFSIFKNWRFGERVSGQFRAEFFNVLNHPNFANPYGAPTGFGGIGFANPLSPGLFGCECATPDVASGNPIVGSGDARAIQFGFKLRF